MFPGDMSCSQIGSVKMTCGYLINQVKQNSPSTKRIHHQVNIESHLLKMNGPSHRQEMSTSGVTLPLEQHFLRNKSHERYHASVCDIQYLRRVQISESKVNKNK